jgi:hypothetical protein
MRVAVRAPRLLWWLGIVLASASLFAPGGRDLPTSPSLVQHPLAAILYPTVGQDALVEQPVTRVGEPGESARSGRPSIAWAPITAVVAVVLLGAAAALERRPWRSGCDRRVPGGRRRGPPRPEWSPRARPAHLLVSA